MGVGTFLAWIGGGISRAAATALVVGIFFVVTGVLPWEAVALIIDAIPQWMTNGWLRLLLIIFGLVIIGVSFRWNLWSQRQHAIDSLAEDIAWAIRNLLNWRSPNRDFEITTVQQWERHYRQWCDNVSKKLGNRAFFTRADQLHFDRLGFVDPVTMSDDSRQNWFLSQLRMKFERLRDIINWSQLRRR